MLDKSQQRYEKRYDTAEDADAKDELTEQRRQQLEDMQDVLDEYLALLP